MNLHGTVRGAIGSVNPDITALYRQSIGSTSNADFSRTPGYAPGVPVRCQVQPPGSKDLQIIERLQMQGVFRTVFMYGNPQGIVRPFAQGGDLLTFAPMFGQPPQVWKVISADGPWNVEQGGWSKVIVVLQTDNAT